MTREWDTDSSNSTTSSESLFDEDDVNVRVYPDWAKYRHTIERGAYRLDTCRDVREHYEKYCPAKRDASGYLRACGDSDDDALCRDAGLPENLYRGTRVSDGAKIIVKAVHLLSREFAIIKFLSAPPQRDDPMNHCIPVLDLMTVPEDELAFVFMEEWSSQLITDQPCCLRLFMAALQQCIDHTAFMHEHYIAHLDISTRNLLTDDKGHYACIDYELSRQFDSSTPSPQIQGHRATEIPPEFERGEMSDPYKADIWALAVLILQTCKLTGYHIPELLHLTKPMLDNEPSRRPTAVMVQKAFDSIVSSLGEDRLEVCMVPP